MCSPAELPSHIKDINFVLLNVLLLNINLFKPIQGFGNMAKQRHKRTYTTRAGNYPSGWRVVREEDIANAVSRIAEYLKKVKKQIPKLIVPLDIRFEEGKYSRAYHFGGNIVTEKDTGRASLIFNAGSKQGLDLLLEKSELKVFESKRRRK